MAATEKLHKPARGARAVDMRSVQPTKSAKLVALPSICAVLRRGEPRDRIVSWVAQRQLNLITTRQLNAAGLTSEAIALRCSKGLLHRVHQGVYLVGPQVWLPNARELAAILALGRSAVVSHRSAAALWGFATPSPRAVEVTIVGAGCRSRDGIGVRRVSDLLPDERAHKNGIPVTSPARTLLDFAHEASPHELEQALAEAYALNLTSERRLQRIVARRPHRAGARALRAELERERGPALTRSEAERRMKQLLREAGLPAALTNQRIAGYEADFVWPERRLIVEVDGYQFHGHRAAFERDRKRDAAHTLAGYRVMRITWRALTEERMAVAVIIARALEVTALPSSIR